MKVHYRRDHEDRLIAIARDASLYDWLVGLTRRRKRPQHIPRQLHADLGLQPAHERIWPLIR